MIIIELRYKFIFLSGVGLGIFVEWGKFAERGRWFLIEGKSGLQNFIAEIGEKGIYTGE